MSYSLMAQETEKQKEVGLVFSNLNFQDFGFTYRVGTQKSMWRFNTILLSGYDREILGANTTEYFSRFGFELNAGKERRLAISEKFELRYGADISFAYERFKNEIQSTLSNGNERSYSQTTYSPGMQLVLGFNYVLKNNLILGAEVLPSIVYTTGSRTEKRADINNGEEVKSDISGFEYGFSNNAVLVSLVYRFARIN
jgi:hypothetical protein